jgi:hypothetical protein
MKALERTPLEVERTFPAHSAGSTHALHCAAPAEHLKALERNLKYARAHLANLDLNLQKS